MALAALGRALAHRNYRLYVVGQAISLLGTWVTRVAMSWLVYRLTGSAVVLGVIAFAGQLPALFLGPFAGAIIDRLPRRRLLVITQALSMARSAALAVLTLGGLIEVWHVAALACFQGVVNALDTPARQAMLVDLLEDKGDLPNAIALNSSMVNATRLAGPAVAGVLIAAFGEGVCFAIDAVSYVAVIASLLFMRLRREAPVTSGATLLADVREGLRYVAGFRPVRGLLLLLGLISLVGLPHVTLLPIVASEVLDGDARTLGFLSGASGLGAVLAALWLAARPSVLGLDRVVVVAAGVFSCGLLLLAVSRSFTLSLLAMAVIGAGLMVEMAATNTLLQTIVDEDKRGRVMSFYTMAFFGASPFGSLLGGVAAARVGAPLAIAAGALFCAVGAAWFARELPEIRRLLRPIYVRLGILPQPADALHPAPRLQRSED